jgi:hypothetical protein
MDFEEDRMANQAHGGADTRREARGSRRALFRARQGQVKDASHNLHGIKAG